MLNTALWIGCLCVGAAQDPPHYAAELVFPLHPLHNHAPGIAELPNGELIVSWYRGPDERGR